ncbi:MAG TPA: PAS domain S-box protein [Gemmatimonadales bacterium]|nr:PAS domain S-box protein [Gemmatimonadales bacterium]
MSLPSPDAVAAALRRPERLEALRRSGLLDAPPEAALERLTQLAVRLLDAPIALVSLLDADRQVFASCAGLPEPWAAERRTPLTHSFCQYTVTLAGPLVVADARAHPVLRENRAIPDLGVVAYAGVPLATRGGEVLGTLCVLDRRPRQWSEQDLAVLSDLAGLAVSTIELRAEIAARRETEARFDALFHASAVGKALVAPDGRLLDVNASLCAMLGYTHAELVGRTAAELTHPDDLAETRRCFEDLRSGRSTRCRQEKRYLRADGRVVWAQVEAVGVPDASGAARYMLSEVRDLTERKQAELELREAEAQFRSLTEQSLVGIYRIEAGRFTYANPQLADTFGYTVPELLALPSYLELVHPDDRAMLEARIRRRLEGERLAGPTAFRGVRRDGTVVEVEAHGGAVRLEDGRPVAVGTLLDVTGQRRAEAELRASEAELRAVLEAMSEVIIVLDDEGRYLKVVPGAHHDVIIPPEALLGRTAHEVFPAELADRFVGWVREALARRDLVTAEYALPMGDHEAWFAAAITPLDEHRVLLVARDITERRHAEEALRRSEERYRTLVAASAQIVWSGGPHGEWTETGWAAWAAFTGQTTPPTGEATWAAVIHPDDRAAALDVWHRAMAEPRAFEVGYRLRHHSGEWRDVLVRGVPLRDADGRVREWIGTITDVTEQVRAEAALRASEAQLRQAQKMEAVGQLAGGVAHDFNNLLAAIAVNCALLQGTVGTGPGAEEVEEIRRAAERASLLTRQLLTFSRKQVVQPQVVDLNRLVSEALLLIERLPGTDIAVELELEPGLGTVRADPGQLTQVLMNLAVNARDAMPDGGRLRIRTTNVAAEGQPWVALAVSDTGVGMDAETQARIFEPFFTTKPPGKGTGLGLSTVYGIVQQSGGHLTVDSAPGRGTTITVFLPPATGELPADGRAAPPKLPSGSETVLLVEDETSVRNSVRRLLAHHGYRVLEARSGAEALARFAEEGEHIGLLVTDIVMPEMSGRQLVEQLRAQRPALPVLFMSGYDEEAVTTQGALPPGTGFIAKPFTVEALLHAVRGVLDARSAAARD